MVMKPGFYLFLITAVCLVMLPCLPAAASVHPVWHGLNGNGGVDCLGMCPSRSVTVSSAAIRYGVWPAFLSGNSFAADDSVFTLERRSSSKYLLLAAGKDGRQSRWVLPFPVFRFIQADLDKDGVAEALVGVEKKTRFDPVKRKRLFVFRWRHGAVRPAWLGSRMGGNLQDFRVVTDTAGVALQTMEAGARDGLYSVCLWRWGSFGPRFDKYICTALPCKEAVKIFNKAGGAE
jgi:hypothetical protein